MQKRKNETAVGSPRVSIAVSGSVIPPPGLPVYPLASDPGQTWDLQDANGVLTWVQFSAPPGQKAFGLENAGGLLLLEDGAGVLLMKQ